MTKTTDALMKELERAEREMQTHDELIRLEFMRGHDGNDPIYALLTCSEPLS